MIAWPVVSWIFSFFSQDGHNTAVIDMLPEIHAMAVTVFKIAPAGIKPAADNRFGDIVPALGYAQGNPVDRCFTEPHPIPGDGVSRATRENISPTDG